MSSKDKIERLQKVIRDAEWEVVVPFIPKGSTFLDVGCGSGYALHRAFEDCEAKVTGIDPAPNEHGVGRFVDTIFAKQNIITGSAEELPFEAKSFDIIYSSHVLEHVNSEEKILTEMHRVLKMDGTLILAMPTASMALISWLSQLIFTTHIKIYEFIRKCYTKEAVDAFVQIFRIKSHSYPRASSIFYDLSHYREKKWGKTISKTFLIEKKISPFLYPFPDFYQWFPFHKNKMMSSSVIFICRKKND